MAIQIFCAYCSKEIITGNRSRTNSENPIISHGMCKACRDYFLRQWHGISLSEYLNDFAHPVMVLDENGRVLGTNRESKKLISQTDAEHMAGLPGGDVLECAYARLPGGCGNTVHCPTCSIRNMVCRIAQSHIEEKNVPAVLSQPDRTLHFRLSGNWDDASQTIVLHLLTLDSDQ